MDLNKFTKKSLEVVEASQKEAIKRGNPQLEEIHIHSAIVNQQDGLIPRVLSLMDINMDLLRSDLERELSSLPSQSGGGQLYPSREYTKVLYNGEEEAKRFNDEYVGVEHIYIGLLKERHTRSEKIFKKNKINLQDF